MEKYKNRIKETLLSEENKDKDKITPQMRQKIANNEEILDSDLSDIILYRYAFRELETADSKLKDSYSKTIEEANNNNNQRKFTKDLDFLPNQIAIYDRFIKAKKELEKYEDYKDIAKLAAASRDVHQALDPKLNPPSQT